MVKALDKALKFLKVRKTIRFKDKGVVYTLVLDDILYVAKDSGSRKCIIKTDYTDFKINKNFSEMADMVSNMFIKTHRSCLVNRDRVRMINKKNNTITFDNGIVIDLLSNNYRKDVV